MRHVLGVLRIWRFDSLIFAEEIKCNHCRKIVINVKRMGVEWGGYARDGRKESCPLTFFFDS